MSDITDPIHKQWIKTIDVLGVIFNEFGDNMEEGINEALAKIVYQKNTPEKRELTVNALVAWKVTLSQNHNTAIKVIQDLIDEVRK